MRQIMHNKRCLLWSPDGASFIICLAGNGSPVQRQISLQSWSSISSTQLWISTILMLLLPWRDALEPVWNTDPIYCTIHQRMLFQWLVLFRPDLSPSNATQHSARIVQHTKIKMPFYVKQWVLNLSFRGPTICKIIKTLADWKLEFIVPVFLISLNVNGFMLSAGNNSPHKTHYSLFSLNTFTGAWVVFSFLFHIFIHGLSICLVIWLTYQVTKLW